MTKLRKKMIENGWLYKDLARESGVDRTIIYRYAHGKIKKPNNKTLFAFAKALNCDVEEIVED